MSNFRQRLGPALVAEGVITPEQLMEAQTLHKRHPHLPISQIVSIIFRIPAETIDAVNLRSVVLPAFEPVLRRRLWDIAAKDRFAKNFPIDAYVVTVRAEALAVENRSVQVRRYEREDVALVSKDVKGFMNTQATLLVTIGTATDMEVTGEVTVRHDTETRALVIMENDGDLKNALYYSLRESFKNTTGNS